MFAVAARPTTEQQRVSMTLSCADAASIPKVDNAGRFETHGGVDVQIMHNGLKVVRGGYYGRFGSQRELRSRSDQLGWPA